MKRFLIWAIALTLIGCGASGAQLAGTYTAKLVDKDGKKVDLSAAGQGESNVSLELRADNSYTMVTAGQSVEGRWQLAGSQLRLNPERTGDSEETKSSELATKKINLEVSADGKVLTPDTQLSNAGKVTLEKN
ncbi:MAG: hypothetical protein U0R49_12140 [Fimbriimonadales bacterium]